MSMSLWTRAALSVTNSEPFKAFSPEAWQYAGEMTLLGMGMIFLVLALLWGTLGIFKLVFAAKTPSPDKKAKVSKPQAEEKKPDAPSVPQSTEQNRASEASDTQNDALLVAILTAAVTAYREEEGVTGGFRVVSFKRAGGTWNRKK